MSKPRKQDGVVYSRDDGKVLWMRYRDRNGKRCRESTGTEDWQEANRKLRERLQARDGNLLEAIRKGEFLAFEEWVDSFLENYSKPSPTSGEDSRGEPALCHPPEGGVFGQKAGGRHSRRHRRLSSAAASAAGSGKTG